MRRLLSALVAVLVVAAAAGVGLAGAGSRMEAGWVARELPGSPKRPCWTSKSCGQANAINNKGWVVGSTELEECYHAALWVNGRLRDLGTLGGGCSIANDINDRGQVVGWSKTRSGSYRAFLWEKGRMRDLGTIPGPHPDLEATAINERGQIVGRTNTSSGNSHAWLWQEGTMRDLGVLLGKDSGATDINDLGQVVGWSSHRVFLYEKGRVRILPLQDAEASINNRGQIATYGTRLLWENGKTRSLGFSASAINERGEVVGCRGYKDVVVWKNGKTSPLPVPNGVTERCANDINDRGHAVGFSQEGPLDASQGGEWWAWLWTKTG
jgi:probable HAF family extracellular repeat protein